jgi:hypothetical protein
MAGMAHNRNANFVNLEPVFEKLSMWRVFNDIKGTVSLSLCSVTFVMRLGL